MGFWLIFVGFCLIILGFYSDSNFCGFLVLMSRLPILQLIIYNASVMLLESFKNLVHNVLIF